MQSAVPRGGWENESSGIEIVVFNTQKSREAEISDLEGSFDSWVTWNGEAALNGEGGEWKLCALKRRLFTDHLEQTPALHPGRLPSAVSILAHLTLFTA